MILFIGIISIFAIILIFAPAPLQADVKARVWITFVHTYAYLHMRLPTIVDFRRSRTALARRRLRRGAWERRLPN